MDRALDASRVEIPNWGEIAACDHGVAGWNRRHADEITQTISSHLVLVSFLPYSKRETRLGGSRVRTADAPSGACEIVPGGADYWARWHQNKEVSVFSLREDWLNRLALEHDGRDRAIIHADGLPMFDPHIEALGRMLRLRLQDRALPSLSGLELDSLLTILGIRLLGRYAGPAKSRVSWSTGLGPHRMRKLKAYLSDHLDSPVRLHDLAEIAKISEGHLLRAFRIETGTSPHVYLTRMRLDRVRDLLTRSDLSLAQIALDTGFSSQSHMTSVMRRIEGITPHQFRLQRS